MSFHPHLHCIVPSGGIDGNGNWKDGKKSGSFLLPVKVMGARFKHLFVEELVEMYREQKLNIYTESTEKYQNPAEFRALIKGIHQKKWVVYAQPPMAGVRQVIDYLGRYVHRVAIANHRIVSAKENSVIFEYKDYSNATEKAATPIKNMTLTGEEFVRRFAQHILPKSFQKVRYYGFYGTSAKKKHKALTEQLKGRIACVDTQKVEKIIEIALKTNVDCCLKCNGKNLTMVDIPQNRSWIFAPKDYCRPPPQNSPQTCPVS